MSGAPIIVILSPCGQMLPWIEWKCTSQFIVSHPFRILHRKGFCLHTIISLPPPLCNSGVGRKGSLNSLFCPVLHHPPPIPIASAASYHAALTDKYWPFFLFIPLYLCMSVELDECVSLCGFMSRFLDLLHSLSSYWKTGLRASWLVESIKEYRERWIRTSTYLGVEHLPTGLQANHMGLLRQQNKLS